MGNEGKFVFCARTKGKPSKKCPRVMLRWRKPLQLREAMALYNLLESNGFSCWLEKEDERDTVPDAELHAGPDR